jgi:sensor histidine kinase regulating citrate/malate metabolism
MHAVITLVELGRYEDAISFATEELRAAQHLTDQVVGAISEPVIAAVLLGKAQVAAERGIDFVVTPDSGLDAAALIDAEISAREMLTVIGNLVDNAIDAVADSAVRKVSVTVRRTDPEADALLIEVADTGPGLDEESALLAFRRGWSTKTDTTVHGHGLGLGLVGQIVQRHGGSIIVEQSGGAVFRVEIGAGLRTRAASSASSPE